MPILDMTSQNAIYRYDVMFGLVLVLQCSCFAKTQIDPG